MELAPIRIISAAGKCSDVRRSCRVAQLIEAVPILDHNEAFMQLVLDKEREIFSSAAW
jgi:hypothetical protein